MTKTKMLRQRSPICPRVRRGALQPSRVWRTPRSLSHASQSRRSSRSLRSTASVDHPPTPPLLSAFKSAIMLTATKIIASARRDWAKRSAIYSRHTSPPLLTSASPPAWKKSSTPLQRVVRIGVRCCRSSGAPSIHSFLRRRNQLALESSATVPARRSAPKGIRWRSASGDSVGTSPARCIRNMQNVSRSRR